MQVVIKKPDVPLSISFHILDNNRSWWPPLQKQIVNKFWGGKKDGPDHKV